MRIQIDKASTQPLYLQLAQAISDQIASGELKPGDKLPTVREMFSDTGISEGTIRHAYEHLSRAGEVALLQGKGTFVTQRHEGGSREARAMSAIDSLIAELEQLGFSAREMRMFIDVKLGTLEDDRPLTPVAVVDCNPEALNEAAGQLSDLPDIELGAFLLGDVRRAPHELLKGYPLIITTQTHAHELATLLTDHADRIGRVVLSPSAQTVAALARIEAGCALGVFCKSARFAGIVKNGLRMFPHLRAPELPVLLAGEGDLAAFADRLQALVVSADYLSYASPADREALGAFVEAGGQLIPYHHRIDRGSFMYIEERIKQIMQ